MSRRLRLATSAVLAAIALMLAPAAALAAGNDVGHNIGSLLRQYAGEVYGGIVAVVGLVFLVNRKFTELAMFLPRGDHGRLAGLQPRSGRQRS